MMNLNGCAAVSFMEEKKDEIEKNDLPHCLTRTQKSNYDTTLKSN